MTSPVNPTDDELSQAIVQFEPTAEAMSSFIGSALSRKDDFSTFLDETDGQVSNLQKAHATFLFSESELVDGYDAFPQDEAGQKALKARLTENGGKQAITELGKTKQVIDQRHNKDEKGLVNQFKHWVFDQYTGDPDLFKLGAGIIGASFGIDRGFIELGVMLLEKYTGAKTTDTLERENAAKAKEEKSAPTASAEGEPKDPVGGNGKSSSVSASPSPTANLTNQVVVSLPTDFKGTVTVGGQTPTTASQIDPATHANVMQQTQRVPAGVEVDRLPTAG